jgi:plasmid stability protein
MPDILIRTVPEDIYAALKEKAASDGKGLEPWLRERLAMLAAQPTIRKRYKFTALGENGAKVTIERHYADGPVQRGAKNCSQEQFDAFQKAALLAECNELGDYEAAYKLLLTNFDEVFAS